MRVQTARSRRTNKSFRTENVSVGDRALIGDGTRLIQLSLLDFDHVIDNTLDVKYSILTLFGL
jgi:hypothetical protein